jgi:hypothetical protein
VLTKPDIVPKLEESHWLDILHNRTFPIEHGYYMTCQATTKQRIEGITHEENKANEEKFFKSIHPWCDEPNKALLGTENLMHAIRSRLSEMIVKR